ncbi:MAG: DUF523 and DUF1722 domain-containing protein [Pseudomonadales bacterium]|nr:DUF523 and DUF1722 domain-containing protein [Pseudomonadales bacterium]
MTEENQPHKIPVGISSCLLGERVRYDGGHKGHSYISQTLGEYFQFSAFCPEMAIGLGVPRKPIRLQKKDNKEIHCVEINDQDHDYTGQLQDCADKQQHWQRKLCGYILKKDSPSCGMERVKVWDEVMPSREGVGVFAGRMMENLPWLPVEEEGRLGDAVLRENFIQRVFAMRRWHQLESEGITVGSLVDFHARHKLILMSRDQVLYRELGRFVADTNKDNLQENIGEYLLRFMSLMKIRATRKNHVNVLQHIQGYLKNHLDGDDKQEMVQTIDKYRQGQLPLIVPITLLNHHFRKFPNEYISNSFYMDPYPEELCLQNAI